MTYKYLHAVGESSYWLDHRLVPEVRAMFAAMASRAPAGGIRARYQQILDAMMDTTGTSTWEAKGYKCAGHREAWQFDCSACGEPFYATEGDEKPPTRCVSCFGPVPKDCWDAEDRLCRYPLHPKVQKFFNDFVGSYGHSSIMELTGSPAVYTEGISWLTAWLLFDSPLCAGQEFSTRAVQHKDWPMARDAEELHYIHDTWFAVFEAEVAWWKEHLASPENRAALGIGDKEPFRPALDRARWALPGTISTGCAHTSSLRERARVLRDGSLLAQASQSEKAVEVWAEIADTYRKALPGLAGMGLREAVYDATGNQLSGHLRALLTDVADGPDVFVDAITFPGIDSDTEDFIDETPRPGEKTYRDPIVNHQCRVGVQFRCSLAVARDWHRHRTLFPWTLQLVRDDNGHIQIDHHYEPKSDYAKKTVPGLLGLSTLLFNRLMEQGNVMTAALALPLGARVSLRGSGGLRDVTYMLELRKFAVGANFEYQDQATQALEQLNQLI